MRVVLLSGGSGKRLWPLSNEIRSKIFLKLLPAEAGGVESMLQRVCRQLDLFGLLARTTIVAHSSQLEMTRQHIGGDVPVIGEPLKRGTYPAIALAASYLHTVAGAAPEETVCVLPADLFVEPAFFETVCRLPDALHRSGAQLGLIGAPPLQPSAQYGYIVREKAGTEAYAPVARFVEKPDEPAARALIRQRALWNCGVFGFRLSFMLSLLARRGEPATVDGWLSRYEGLAETSFDQEVAERTASSIVLPYKGTWKDLGSWETMTSRLGGPVTGRGHLSGDCANTHVVSELPIPVHVIGIKDAIVAAGPDGVLVAAKGRASEIKRQLASIDPAMREETHWGSWLVLDRSTEGDAPPSVTRKVRLLQDKHIGYDARLGRKVVWTLLTGRGELLLEGRLSAVQAGDVVAIPPGAPYALRALTLLELIEVQLGGEPGEEDAGRLALSWEEALLHCRGPEPG